MGLTLNANLDEMELAKELSDESKACDALLDKTVMHLKHLELIDAPKYDSHQSKDLTNRG
jgi:hypothetical protein